VNYIGWGIKYYQSVVHISMETDLNQMIEVNDLNTFKEILIEI